jgi:diguanylate cyclase (GGDEF)-like protein
MSLPSDFLPASPEPTPRLAIPLGTLALLVTAASVVLATAVGYALAWSLAPAAPWMVGLAAGFGVLCTALPLGAIVLGLARRLPPEPATTVEPQPAAAPTGLHGLALAREPFIDLVGREWARSRRYGTGAALLLVEIDRYARLAEVLGEAAGERVLAALLQHVAPTLRGADALARYAPGQIAVFLAHADATGALDVAERIRERAEQMEVPIAPKRVRFTVSIGVAHLRPAHLHLHALLDDVAEAAAAARTVGGNCVRAAPIEASQRPAPGAAPRDGHRADKN